MVDLQASTKSSIHELEEAQVKVCLKLAARVICSRERVLGAFDLSILIGQFGKPVHNKSVPATATYDLH